MLKLLRVEAIDFLCYSNLVLDVTKFNLVQLVADNGVGKTNILSVITEALYGKNPRGYSKGELFNRYTGKEKYTISVTFSKDGSTYVAATNRTKSVAKVTLNKDGVDITSHTSKGTFSEIESIIGLDYELFLQYVYQSSKFSTEFLTATPATRKQFLGKMLGLEKISEDIEKVSAYIKGINAKLNTLSIEKRVAQAGLPPAPTPTKVTDIESLRVQLNTLLALQKEEQVTERAYSVYLAEKAQLESEVKNRSKKLDSLTVPTKEQPKPKLPTVYIDENELVETTTKLGVLNKELSLESKEVSSLTAKIKALKSNIPNTSCHVCGSSLNNEEALALHNRQIAELSNRLTDTNLHIKDLKSDIALLEANVKLTQQCQAANAAAAAVTAFNLEIDNRYEKAMSAYKAKVQVLVDDLNYYERKLSELPVTTKPSFTDTSDKINRLNKEIIDAEYANASIKKRKELEEDIHNIEDMSDTLNAEVHIAQILLDSLKHLLAKTIDNGLASLELNTNKYLRKFGSVATISFIQEDSKLNVKMTVAGATVNYYTLSTGQAARVSISTLLAMRELLVDSVNLLILDEVVGTLDTEGKESLIEVLTEIKGMNIFLVSHDWTHPLLEKIEVKASPTGSFISYG